MSEGEPSPETEVTIMPSDQFDALVATLDVPDECPVLAAAASRPRRFARGDEPTLR